MLWQHVRNDCRDNYRNKSRFQRMASSLCYSTIGSKTPASSGVAPQRAGSTRYRASVLYPARMYELRSVLTAILPLQTMRWVPHYPHFSSLFIFYENRWFDINLCQILIEFRWCETLSRSVQTSCTFALSPCVYGFAYTTLRACWPHSEALFCSFSCRKMRLKKPVLQTKAAFKLNLLINFLDKEERVFTKKIKWK